MPTIIDSLIVKLGLDSSGYKRGTAEIKQTQKEMSAGFNDVAKEAAKFLAVLGGTVAIKRFVSDMIETNAALDRLSKNLNQNVSDISAWSNAAELAGGSAEGLQGAMDMLSKSQTELKLTGQSTLIPYFSALGLSLADAYGRARPVNNLLIDLADRFASMDRTTANNMGRMMGLDQGTMNLLLEGRQSVELMIKRQKEHGVVSKQQAEEASRLRRSLIEGKQAFTAFGRELLSTATPALERIFAAMSGFGNWMRENQEFVRSFLSIMAVGLGTVVAATIPINLTAAAITGLAAAIALLYNDYQAWKRGGESLIDWGKWEPGITAAKNGLTALRDLLSDLVYRAIAAGDMIGAVISGDRKRYDFAKGEFLAGRNGGGSSNAAPGPSSSGKIGARMPRGIRNNNPGNLNFAGQAGATKEGGAGGRFARFSSMESGVAALVKQIGLYVGRGKNTIRKILETYAPSSENNTGAYISAVSRALGISADEPLDLDNANQVMGLVKAIANHENGGAYLSDEDVLAGYNLAAGGIRGASKFASGAGASKVARSNSGGGQVVKTGSNSSEVHIGTISVNTQATDANGIARDIGKSMDYLFTSQANYGLTP